ncbi:response regulator [Thermodesulfobacterium sp. TA1]|uniref:response regulator n=1 Tax=Thermodesulfobacterium sp. TA1 TaxID=2234087 RepID=UPI0012320AC1|nr:response regulator [Thermodesulfobacterium sp. TA1]QER42688.1 response regulator [Thermodesulfobacterium sp. TA1]
MEEKISLLIIDDEEDFLDIMFKRLSKRGFTVFTSISCNNGLEVLKQNQVDVIVLDVLMPDKDGIECLKEIKKLYNIPVILLTGHASAKVGLESIKLGAKDYCLKPIDLEELIEKIRIVYRDSKIQ